MIEYRYDEEKITALYFSDLLNNELVKEIIIRGEVKNKQEATMLSRFFWDMVNKSAEGDIDLPCEGGSEYWLEKLYNSFGGYLEQVGFEDEWNNEVDRA